MKMLTHSLLFIGIIFANIDHVKSQDDLTIDFPNEVETVDHFPEGHAGVSYKNIIPIAGNEILNKHKQLGIIRADATLISNTDSSGIFGEDSTVSYLPVEMKFYVDPEAEDSFTSFRRIGQLKVNAIELALKNGLVAVQGLGYEYARNELGLYEAHKMNLLELNVQEGLNISKDGQTVIIIKGMAKFAYGSMQDLTGATNAQGNPITDNLMFNMEAGLTVGVTIEERFLASYFIGTEIMLFHQQSGNYFRPVEGVTLSAAIDKNKRFNIFVKLSHAETQYLNREQMDISFTTGANLKF